MFVPTSMFLSENAQLLGAVLQAYIRNRYPVQKTIEIKSRLSTHNTGRLINEYGQTSEIYYKPSVRASDSESRTKLHLDNRAQNRQGCSASSASEIIRKR